MFPLYKTLACLAIGTLAVTAIALAAVEAGQLHEQVLAELERRLDEQFVGDFDADRITGSLVWGFTAHDVEIRDSGGEPVAHVDELQVDASAFELLDGHLRFDRARLVRPTVLIERYADGSSNVDNVFDSRRPGGSSRPPDEVLFEMTRAEVVDGQLVYVDSGQPAPSTTLAHPGGTLALQLGIGDRKMLDPESTRVVVARQLHAEGSFQVISGKRTQTLIDRLDAEITPDASADPIQKTGTENKPRHVRMRRARLDTDPTTCILGADSLTLDDRWRIDDLIAARPRGASTYDAGPIKPVRLRGRASSPDGGWLEVEGQLDRRDDSFRLELEASRFKPAGWPGAPGWPWLVLDGDGSITGDGRTGEGMNATVRWSANDIDVAGQQLDDLRLVAHIADQQVDVEKLDITAGGFLGSVSGHLTKAGAFALEMDTQFGGAFAKELAAQAGHYRVGAQLPEAAKFEVSIAASGGLDLSEVDAGRLVEHAKLDTTWKARDISLEDLGWKVAGGSLKAQVPSAPPARRTNRRFSYEASAALHELHRGAFGADMLRTTVRGDGVFDASDGLEGLSYKLEADVNRATLGEHRAERVRLGLTGALSPAAQDATWPLKGLAAKGALDLFEYRGDKVTARRIATNIDVRGAFPVGEGTIETHATGLRVDDRRFRHAHTKLYLLGDQKFRLQSKARVEISIIPDLPMYLDVSGRHGRDLKALSLDKFTIGRPGMRWKIRKPGLVLFKDGAVELKSLTLQRRSQRVRLDGEYGEGKKGSVSAIASRLTSAQIRSFFDFSAIF